MQSYEKTEAIQRNYFLFLLQSIFFVSLQSSNYDFMTTIELRTSIAAELDQMSVEMLESVSRYVKRLRHHPRTVKDTVPSNQVATDELSPRVLQFQRGNPWYATDQEVDNLRHEYLTKKYK